MSDRWMKMGCTAVLIGMLTFLLAACGGSDSGDKTTAGGDEGDLSGTSLTFVSYGGDQEVAYKEAFISPFEEKTGASVAMDSPTDYAKVKAQVETNNVAWDVMVGDPFLTLKDCGVLYEELTDVDRADIDPKYITDDCSLPADIYATVLVYDKNKFGDNPPTGWADFFDLKKYPGKRGMWSFVIGNQFEHALQADGVESDSLYPLDMERAIKKLDTIKSEISFYDTLAQSSEQLIAGEVSMSIMYAQRAYDAEKAGAEIGVVWDGGIQSWDSLVILKGSKNLEAANQLVDFIGTPEAQAHMATITPFGPTNVKAEPDVPEEIARWQATTPANAEVSIPMDMEWWSKNYDAANQTFTDWTSG